MNEYISDIFIAQLKAVRKRVENPKAQLTDKAGHWQKDYSAYSLEDEKIRFRIILRRNKKIKDDFSCIILYEQTRLARYNGSSHRHGDGKNHPKIEYDFHIHSASEQALKKGKNIDYYAEPTDRYNDINGALGCLLHDFNVSGITAPNRTLDLN